MQRMDLESLVPEFISNEITWSDFFEALADTIQEQIRGPIKELEDIRHIVEDSDPELVSRTLKQLGFDIPADLIAHNATRLAKSVYMLAMFHERSGTADFVRGVAFVLGRHIVVESLYTNNYVDFYTEPGGPLLKDGGDWYKTTHIDLGMELLPSDANMVLPVGQTLADRLMNAYFEFAPINHVVREFYYLIRMQATLGIAGRVDFGQDIFRLFGDTLSNVELQIPNIVEGNSQHPAVLDANYYEDECRAIPRPVYGHGPAQLTDISKLQHAFFDVATQHIPTQSTDFTWVAVPAALGTVTFVDVGTMLIGGFDGASWSSDVPEAERGPVRVTHNTMEWDLYRSDNKTSRTFRVELQYSGLRNTCDTVLLQSVPEPQPEIEEPEDEQEECDDMPLPLVGSASAVTSESQLEFLTHTSSIENQRITVDVPEDQYGFFAYPVALGLATFIETVSGLEGGWGGATWGDSIGTSTDPVIVVRRVCDTPVEYFVYRTELSGIGQRQFEVAFQNPGQETPTYKVPDEEKCAPGFPTFMTMDADVVDQNDLLNAHVLDSTENTSLSGNIDNDERGFLAYPIEMGVATFNNVLGEDELWSSPVLVQRTQNNRIYNWFVHRTERNVGQVGFEVKWPNSGMCVDLAVAFPPSDAVEEPDEPAENEVPCAVNGLPVFGAIPSFRNQSIDVLEGVLSDTSSQNFEIDIPNGTYGYFAYPAALGKATFTDVNSGLVGGWGGATWDENLNIGDDFGPATIYVEQDGVLATWYLYRTSWPGLGRFTFYVDFENSVELGAVADNCEIDAPEFDTFRATLTTFRNKVAASRMVMQSVGLNTPSCHVNGSARVGTGNHISSALQIKLFDDTGHTDNHSFELDVEQDAYGWYAHPAALGVARFIDSRTHIEGGFDGARWPEGHVELTSGPVMVMLHENNVETPWFLYRTDMSGVGRISFEVMFERNGLSLGDSVPCEAHRVPPPLVFGGAQGTQHRQFAVGTSDQVLTNNAMMNDYLNEVDLENGTFTLTAQPGQFGYFAYPTFLGLATIESANSIEWQSEKSPHPRVIYRRTDGELRAWYLYKTTLPGTGTNTFSVTFGQSIGRSGKRVERINMPVLTTDRPDIVSFRDNVVRFAPVYRDTRVRITATHLGVSDTQTVVVKAAGFPVNHITIAAPNSVAGNSTMKLTVTAHYDDNSRRVLTADEAEIRVIDPHVLNIVQHTVHVGNPSEDTTLFVEARYQDPDNNMMVATATVILRSVVLDRTVEDLYIIGPSELTEGQSHDFRAHAFFSDGTQQDVLALWESSSPGLYVEQSGRATAGQPFADYFAKLKATFQYKSQKFVATKQVEVRRSYVQPVRMYVEGPTNVLELTSVIFRAFIEWSNGTSTQIQPDWSSNRFSINSDGVFTAGSVATSVPVEIVARTEEFSANLIISVYDTPVEIENIQIIGPEHVREGKPASYRTYAVMSHGRQVEVNSTFYLSESHPNSGIDGNELHYNGGEAGIVEIAAEYDNGLRIFRQTKPVVLIPNVTLITGLIIQGESRVLEGERLELTATAVYEDGSTERVEPVWSVRSPDPLNSPEAMADIVSPGILQGRVVEEDTAVIVEARYFREISEFPVIVMPYDRPSSYIPLDARISGPTSLPVTQLGSYVFFVEFDNGCGQEIAVSNDWSLDVGDDVAIIDADGFLRSVNNQTTDVVITAIWSCDTASIERTLQVRLVAEESTLQALFIRGPDVVDALAYHTFTTELFRIDQPIVEGDGEVPDHADLTWSVETIIAGVSISDTGLLYVGDVADGTQIILKAIYTEQYFTVEATKAIIVRSEFEEPEEPEEPDDPEVSYIPVYGQAAPGVTSYDQMRSSIDSEMPSSDSGHEFTTTTSGNNYIYFSHPATLGIATFTEVNSGLDGGMDGASWPADGSIGTVYGPIEITREVDGTEEIWYLYRSDFPGLGEITFRVRYSN